MSSPSPIIEEKLWWRPAHSAPLVLYAPYARGETVRRLSDAIDSWWTPLGKKDVFGVISENGGWLRRRTAYRNSLKTAARLRFADEGSRTRIDMRFGIGSLLILIVMSWVICFAAGVIGYIVAMKEVPSPTEPAALPLFILLPIAAVAIGIVIVASRAGAKKDSVFLTDFVKDTLSAKEA